LVLPVSQLVSLMLLPSSVSMTLSWTLPSSVSLSSTVLLTDSRPAFLPRPAEELMLVTQCLSLQWAFFFVDVNESF